MASFNRVILLGNVTRAVEVKYLQSGMAVAEVGLAVNDKRKNNAGEWVQEVTFVDVTLWGRTANCKFNAYTRGKMALIWRQNGRLVANQIECGT